MDPDKEKSYLDHSFTSLYDENIKKTQNGQSLITSQCSFITDQQNLETNRNKLSKKSE